MAVSAKRPACTVGVHHDPLQHAAGTGGRLPKIDTVKISLITKGHDMAWQLGGFQCNIDRVSVQE